jgi:crossover junction endodeoxyribonuclease RuvC
MAGSGARAAWARKLAGGKGGSAARTPEHYGARQAFEGTLLGVDPSLRGTGLAVLQFSRGKACIAESRTLSPGRSAGLPECLGEIAEAVSLLLARYPVAAMAIEETIYVQNLRTAQKLGAARGAAIGQAAREGIAVFEYSPLRIKQSVVGYGRASKEQVARQMTTLLGLTEVLPYDEADAAAVAMCHAFTEGRPYA